MQISPEQLYLIGLAVVYVMHVICQPLVHLKTLDIHIERGENITCTFAKSYPKVMIELIFSPVLPYCHIPSFSAVICNMFCMFAHPLIYQCTSLIIHTSGAASNYIHCKISLILELTAFFSICSIPVLYVFSVAYFHFKQHSLNIKWLQCCQNFTSWRGWHRVRTTQEQSRRRQPGHYFLFPVLHAVLVFCYLTYISLYVFLVMPPPYNMTSDVSEEKVCMHVPEITAEVPGMTRLAWNGWKVHFLVMFVLLFLSAAWGFWIIWSIVPQDCPAHENHTMESTQDSTSQESTSQDSAAHENNTTILVVDLLLCLLSLTTVGFLSFDGIPVFNLYTVYVSIGGAVLSGVGLFWMLIVLYCYGHNQRNKQSRQGLQSDSVFKQAPPKQNSGSI
jgi:hypothetical protein